MTWDEFRDRVRSQLGEALFTRPQESLAFALETWKELVPDRFTSPLQISGEESGLQDFSTVAKDFLWKILDEKSDTAAIVLWLTLSEWLSGWELSESS